MSTRRTKRYQIKRGDNSLSLGRLTAPVGTFVDLPGGPSTIPFGYLGTPGGTAPGVSPTGMPPFTLRFGPGGSPALSPGVFPALSPGIPSAPPVSSPGTFPPRVEHWRAGPGPGYRPPHTPLPVIGTPRYGSGVRGPDTSPPVIGTPRYGSGVRSSTNPYVELSRNGMPIFISDKDVFEAGLTPEVLTAGGFTQGSGGWYQGNKYNPAASAAAAAPVTGRYMTVGNQFFQTQQAYETWLARKRRGGGKRERGETTFTKTDVLRTGTG